MTFAVSSDEPSLTTTTSGFSVWLASEASVRRRRSASSFDLMMTLARMVTISPPSGFLESSEHSHHFLGDQLVSRRRQMDRVEFEGIGPFSSH